MSEGDGDRNRRCRGADLELAPLTGMELTGARVRARRLARGTIVRVTRTEKKVDTVHFSLSVMNTVFCFYFCYRMVVDFLLFSFHFRCHN